VVAAGAAALAADRPRAPLALPAAFARWLDLERAAYLLLVGPTLALARALARFDDRVLDREIVEAGVARGLTRLGRLARRPQTGQLHQYYAQAAVVLVILVVAFLLAW
jgi:hypothetical protein